jgi:hypothetical protein
MKGFRSKVHSKRPLDLLLFSNHAFDISLTGSNRAIAQANPGKTGPWWAERMGFAPMHV